MTNKKNTNNWKNKEITLETISKIFLMLFFVCKPIYILKSGTFQMGDLFLIISFILLILHSRLNFEIFKKDLLYFVFVVCTFVVNGVYFAFYNSANIMLYSFYYLYNFFAIVTFRHYCNDSKLLKNICYILRVWLLVQVALLFLGIGRWLSSERYMGSFNDPNQLAIYVLMSFYFIKISSKIINLKMFYLDDICALFLVWQSSSTGAIIGIFSYYLFLYIDRLIYFIRFKKFQKFVLLICVTFFAVLMCFMFISGVNFSFNLDDNNIIGRLQSKFNNFTDSNGLNFYKILKDRNMTRIIEFPQYFLYGASEGQAAFGLLSSFQGEIHSTLVGLCFYYGLIPFAVLLVWFIKNIKPSLNSRTWVMGVSLICESFVLANQRQPLFWMIFVLSSISCKDKSDR